MKIPAGIQASLAGRYAFALFELAVEAGRVAAVEGDLTRLEGAIAGSEDFGRIVGGARIEPTQAAGLLASIGEMLELDPLTRNLLGVLAENRRVAQLPRVIGAFKAIAAAQRGEVSAEVVSAYPLSDEQIDSLKRRLTQREGRTVMLSSRVDRDLLGGLVVTIGSERIDASIRTRLNTLSQVMSRG